MQGARIFADLFSTGQHGRLYFVSGNHARGKTFHIYVLPAGEEAIPNGQNSPLNKNAVEVYGIVSGQPGWSEQYGWLHNGPWQEDFSKIVADREAEIESYHYERVKAIRDKEAAEKKRVSELLATY